MLKANGFLAVRIAVALCVVLLLALWLPGQFQGFSNVDADSDGMDDGWEIYYGLAASAAESEDPDGDGLSNGDESAFGIGTDPGSQDTDGDGLTDAEEAVGRLVRWGALETGPGPYVAAPDFGLTALAALSGGCNYMAALTAGGTALCWGDDSCGQCDVPYGETGFTAIAAGIAHTLAVRPDGTVAAWGLNNYGQCDVPYGLTNVAAVSGGYEFSAALCADGTVACWGADYAGQCGVPDPLPAIAMIAAGCAHVAALTESGAVVRWGAADVPAELTPGPALAVAAGWDFTVALMADGTVACWGENWCGQCDAPPGLSNVVAVACGRFHALAATADGRVVGWGAFEDGQTNEFRALSPAALLAGTERCSAAMPQGVTDPTDPDSDHDGQCDGAEVGDGTDPADADTDDDGADDGADPFPLDPAGSLDTDGDGDPDELAAGVQSTSVPPLVEDADDDDDGMPDAWEIQHPCLDPKAADQYGDPDCDGVSNYDEMLAATDPGYADTDGDGLSNAEEVVLQTDPNDPDTDNDWASDGPLDPDGPRDLDYPDNRSGWIAAGPDAFPFDPSASADSDSDGRPDTMRFEVPSTSVPPLEEDADDDNDGMGDEWESTFGFDPLHADADEDIDGDWLSNVEESAIWTNPRLWDTDGDGVTDLWEARAGRGPNSYDPDGDGDGLPDWWESAWFGGTNLAGEIRGDYDGDGTDNAAEFAMGTDPSFVVSWTASSRSGSTVCWTPLPDATNYSVAVWTENGVICSSETMGLSVTVTGAYSSVQLNAQVRAFCSSGAEHVGTSSVTLPEAGDFMIWKLTEPFVVYPALGTNDGFAVYERTFNIGQDEVWPRQFFIAADSGGRAGSFDLGASGLLLGWEIQGQEPVVPQPFAVDGGAIPLPVPAGGSALTVRLRLEPGAFAARGGRVSLDTPLYLIGWAPSVSFTSDTPVEDTPGGPAVVRGPLSAATPVGFSVSWDGRPFDASYGGADQVPEAALYRAALGGVDSGTFEVPSEAGSARLGPLTAYYVDPTASCIHLRETQAADYSGCVFDWYYDECMREGMRVGGYAAVSNFTPNVCAGCSLDFGAAGACQGFQQLSVYPESPYYYPDAGGGSVEFEIRFCGRLIGRVNAGSCPAAPADDYVTEAPCDSVWSGQTAFGGGDEGSCRGECGGSCASGACGADEGEWQNASGYFHFRVPLGKPAYGTLSGMLYLNVQTSSVPVSPALFAVAGNGSVLTNMWPGGGVERAYSSARNGRDVGVEPYSASGDAGVLVTVRNQVGGPVAHTWTIVNEGGDAAKVRFTKREGSLTPADARYEYAGGAWSRTDLLTGRRSVFGRSEDASGGKRWATVTNLTVDSGGRVLAGTASRTEKIGAGRAAVERETVSAEWDGAAGVWRECAMAYWRNDEKPALNGRPRFKHRAFDGFWEYRQYDAYGRETLKAVSLDGGPAPSLVTNALSVTAPVFRACRPGRCKVTETQYDRARPEGGAGDGDRTVTAYVMGAWESATVAREWHTYGTEQGPDGFACVRHKVSRADSPSMARQAAADFTETLSYASATNLSSGGAAPPLLRGRPLSETRREGALTRQTQWQYAPDDTDADGTDDQVEVTSWTGTPDYADGVPMKSTFEVETLDAFSGRALRRETRLFLGGASNAVLSCETYAYDGKGRLVNTFYPDGTSASNGWGCCRLESAVGRDGRARDVGASADGLWSRSDETSLAALEGAEGRYPVTETFFDALGREIRSVAEVYVAATGNEDPAYAHLATVTAYPYGTGNYRVTTNELGVATVSRRYYEGGREVEETSSCGVTSRVSRTQGGDSVTERLWGDAASGGPRWTRETRAAAWTADGRRVETVTAESSDTPARTVSETVYDFLGRVSSVSNPLGVTVSQYDDRRRLSRSERAGAPGVLYGYDELGNAVLTAVDADMDGLTGFAGADRVVSNDTRYAFSEGDWWRVTETRAWGVYNLDSPMLTSQTRERLIGRPAPASGVRGVPDGALLTAETVSVDARGGETRSRAYTDAPAAAAWRVTDAPDSAFAAVTKSVAGRAVLEVTPAGVTNTFAYDGFGRVRSRTDGRGNTTVTHYNALGQADYTQDAAGNRTSYAYDAQGRRTSVTDALGQVTHTAYDPLGNVVAAWGAAYPVAYAYDTAGRMTAMATTRDASFDFSTVANSSLLTPNSSLDVTRWNYDPLTGLLTSKVYADGMGPSYTYDALGRLKTRTWARGVTSTFAYDLLGQLTNTAYSDATPDVSYYYDRLGRLVSAATSASTNLFTHAGPDLVAESHNRDTLKRSYYANGRPQATGVNNMVYGDAWLVSGPYEFATSYGYDACGRLSGVGSSRLREYDWSTDIWFNFGYGYVEGGDAVKEVGGFSDGNSTLLPPVSRAFAYEPARDLVSAVSNFWNGTPVSSHAYENDALGRRTARADDFTSSTRYNVFGYNERSEVIAEYELGWQYDHYYAYDPIGNRKVLNSMTSENFYYAANALNQYTEVAGDAAVAPTYDLDGNMTSYGPWAYMWDAENRMTAAISNNVLRVANTYDHQSRRIRKEVYTRASPSTAYSLQSTASFLYDGWNVIREVSVQSSEVSTNYYTWGLDLSGTLQGAGGVGGLLAVTTVNCEPGTSPTIATYYPTYDANGNITAYLDATGGVAARREFDAFGNTDALSGPLSGGFAYWFSTKYLDEETGLYYYGYRFYHPELGRWVNRDPIGEEGGANVGSFLKNSGVNKYDFIGLTGFHYDEVRNAPWFWNYSTSDLGKDERSVPNALSFSCENCKLTFTVTIKFKIYISPKFKTADLSLARDGRYRTKRGVYGHEQRHVLADQNYWRGTAVSKLDPFEQAYKSQDECKRIGEAIRKEVQSDYDLTFLFINGGHQVLTQELESKLESMNLPIYPGWRDVPANGKGYEPVGGVMPPDATPE